MHDDDAPMTIAEACAFFGGPTRPLDKSTYYRGAKAGRYPMPYKAGPNLSRVSRKQADAARNALIERTGSPVVA